MSRTISAAWLALAASACLGGTAVAEAPLRLAQQADTRPELRVSKEQATAIGVKAVPGRVTSVDLERKGGKVVWVVEVQTPGGDETDVLIDVETGAVLGTE